MNLHQTQELVPLGIPTMNLHQTQELNDIDYHRVLFVIIRVGFYQKRFVHL
jgi:hypothetical protein